MTEGQEVFVRGRWDGDSEKPGRGFVLIDNAYVAGVQKTDVILAEELRDSLGAMLGWALFGEDCDPYYFKDEHEFKPDVEKAKALLNRLKDLTKT